MSVCALSRVRKEYGVGAGRVVALDDVSLRVEPNEFVALKGPSGSGKTTLLNLVGCLDEPTSGRIEIADETVARLSQRQRAGLRAASIGFVFQSFNLMPVLTAAENVELALSLSGKRWDDPRDRARSALAEVGLGGLEARRPAELSGGQQQRVAIARALVKEPALVLADEPTANLDSRTGASVLDLMRRLNVKRGLTFLISTHDASVVERAKRVVSMRDGRIVSDAPRGGRG